MTESGTKDQASAQQATERQDMGSGVRHDDQIIAVRKCGHGELDENAEEAVDPRLKLTNVSGRASTSVDHPT